MPHIVNFKCRVAKLVKRLFYWNVEKNDTRFLSPIYLNTTQGEDYKFSRCLKKEKIIRWVNLLWNKICCSLKKSMKRMILCIDAVFHPNLVFWCTFIAITVRKGEKIKYKDFMIQGSQTRDPLDVFVFKNVILDNMKTYRKFSYFTGFITIFCDKKGHNKLATQLS